MAAKTPGLRAIKTRGPSLNPTDLNATNWQPFKKLGTAVSNR
jgi:hypothetical protein